LLQKEHSLLFWHPQDSKVWSFVRLLPEDGYSSRRVQWYPTLRGYPLSYKIGYPGSMLPSYASPTYRSSTSGIFA